MMFVQHEKPQHHRGVYIRIPVWPRWLAQWLCKHGRTRVVGWGRVTDTNIPTTLLVCDNCNKSILKKTYCRHPYDKWEVVSMGVHETELGGKQEVPLSWYCKDCGYLFHKDMECPSCHVDMKITEWLDSFSGRFHCDICNTYYFREELEDYGERDGKNYIG